MIAGYIKNRQIGGVLLLKGSQTQFTTWIKDFKKINTKNGDPKFLFSSDAEPTLFNMKIKGTPVVKRANEIASMQLIGNVEGADVILVDDLIDTGGTITRAAEVIMNKGAKSVRAICTHPILSGNAYENIENSMLTEMLVTDTIPLRKETSKIKVLTVADLFAKAIYQIQNDASVSSLFI